MSMRKVVFILLAVSLGVRGQVPTNPLDQLLRSARLDDPNWNMRFIQVMMELGRYESARRQATYVLHLQPSLGAAFAQRALAAAYMGDEKRARLDLANALRYDAAMAGRFRAPLEQAIVANRPEISRETAEQDLDTATRAGANLSTLMVKARRLHLAMNASRLRYEEGYTDRVHSFLDQSRSAPNNPDVLVNWSRYLAAEYDLNKRHDTVEPRDRIQSIRMGMQPAKELEHALSLVNQALHLHPNHVRGLSHKAILLAKMGRFADGEPFVTLAAQMAPHDAEVLRLRSEYMTVQYWDGLMSAASMRSSQLVSSREYDEGNRRIREETWRDPSSSQLSAASGLQQAALRMNRGALGVIQAAMQASAGTLEGSILRAEYEFHQQRKAEALAELQKGILLDTKSVLGCDALARFYLRTGNLDNEDEARSMAMNLYNTTAGAKLRIAWRAIARQSWERAQEVLAEAEKLDPADARVPAYQAVVAREKGDAGECARLLMKALSLEEARLNFDDSARSAGVSRSPTSLGLVLRLRFLLAGNGTDGLGLGILQGAADHAQRIKAADGEMQMWTAMLPEPRVEGNVPGITRQGIKRWPSSAQAMAVKAHALFAKALEANGRTEEARRQRALAAAYGPKLVPRNGNRPSSQWVFYGTEDDDGFGRIGVPPMTRRPSNE